MAVFIIDLCSVGFCAQIVYPWNATCAIVKAGDSFVVCFDGDAGQTVSSVTLRGPYNRVVITKVTCESGAWTYDAVTGAGYNTRISVSVPSTTPEERYDLILNTSTGKELSLSAVKVVKALRTDYTLFHISDTHICDESLRPSDGAPARLRLLSALVDTANIIGPEIVFLTGDNVNSRSWDAGNATYLSSWPSTQERVDFYYKGSPKNGYRGVYDFAAPAFTCNGNHDYYERPADGLETSNKFEFWNKYHGVRTHHFAYGDTRFMAFCDAFDEDNDAEAEQHSAWLKEVGPGTLRVIYKHFFNIVPQPWATDHDIQIGMCGHNHHKGVLNPHQQGSTDMYIANFTEYTTFNLFRVDGKGEYTVLNNLPAVENPKDDPSQWRRRLTLDYAKPNDGRSHTNVANVVNRFDVGFPRARVRFVMPKGAAYVVSKGTVEQAFDGDSVHVVDVRVNLLSHSTTEIKIRQAGVPEPTMAEVPYGEHERQVLDFWKAESSTPTPLAFVIHGGGWQGGSKERVSRFVDIEQLLAAGISVAAINYRYVSQSQDAGIEPPLKAPLHDAARALQFIRSKAAEWHIDKTRIGAAGGSAGACSSLWLAYHGDLADPESADPIARESTRLQCAAVIGAQTTLDPRQMKAWMPNSRYGGHAFGKRNFQQFLSEREDILPWIAEYSPYALVTTDDPPVCLLYSTPPALGQVQKDPTHSSNFGVKLQQKCNSVGVPCECVYTVTAETRHTTASEYLIKNLKASGAAFFRFAKPQRAAAKMVVDGFLYVDAEDFDSYGGWRMDTQFVHLMGSPFLMATGIGKPVEDAVTSIEIPKAGTYKVWVRARNWVKSHSPGRFELMVNGKALPKEFGAAETDKWTWEKGGTISLGKGPLQLTLHDLTGFYGRCDAVLLTTDAGYVPPEDKDAVCKERARLQGLSLEPQFAGKFDVIVVGGGSAGVPAAIASARTGAKTALIQNRPTLGGNASVECGVGVQGAGGHHPGWRESGIIEEAGWIRADLEHIDYSQAFSELCDKEVNLTVFLNQHVFHAHMDSQTRIKGVRSVSTLTGQISEYSATMFIDCSGDGWLGYFAGAEYRRGREASSEFNEDLAPDKADKITMSGCIMGDDLRYMTAFRSEKTEHPVKFVRPDWVREIDTLGGPHRKVKRVPEVGSWWMEHPGNIDDIMQAEEARDELIKVSLAFWDYVKNKSQLVEEAKPYDLARIPIMDAKRESRRLVGDYMLTQHDAQAGRMFPDRIAYAGWPLDIHHPEGIYSGEEGAYDFDVRVPINSVPFRCVYSKNIDNLLMAGRCGSFSHVALGTVRVQSTLATIGQAAGTAAGMCVDKKVTPRKLGQKHITGLQQTLLKNDQTIPGLKNEDPRDLARSASVTASSFDEGTTTQLEEITSGRQIPLSMNRSVVIPVKGLRKIDTISLYLESENPEPVEIGAELSALEEFDKLDTAEPVGTYAVVVPANNQEWIEVPVNVKLPENAAFLRIALPTSAKINWPLMSTATGSGGRTYRDTVVKGEFYAVATKPQFNRPNAEPHNVINGWTRLAENPSSMWRSDPSQSLPQWVELDFAKPAAINTVQLTFVTTPNGQRPTHPFSPTCVRDYELSAMVNGEWVPIVKERNNIQRHRIHRFTMQKATKLRLTVSATHGSPSASVFELRAYNEK